MSLRTRRGLALLAALTFVASACGTAASPTVAPSATTAATATPAPSATPNPLDLTKTAYKPTAAATKGGTVVIAEWQSPDSVNPYYGSAFTNIEAFGALAFDSLVNLTYDLGYIPDLAKEVPTVGNGDVVISSDGTKFDVTWKLKDGMKWSDGKPINCDDLIGTWKWIMDKDNTGLAAGTSGWEDITSIDGAGTTTCIVHFGKIFEGYLTLAGPVLPAHYISTVAVKDAPTSLYPLAHPEKGVYSGPYIPTQYVADAQITFVANPNWGTIGLGAGAPHAPYLDKVVMKLYGTAEAMKAGFTAATPEIDVAMDLNDTDIASLKAVPDTKKIIQPSLTYEHHDYNAAALAKKFPGDWQTIVKAVKLTTDRQAIAAGPLAGTVSVSNNFVSPLTWYYKEEAGDTAAHSDQAAALLNAAGWLPGPDGIRAKNNVKLTLEYCTSTRQVRVDTLKLVASQLAAVGIKANVTAVAANPNLFGGWNSTPADTKCNLQHGNYDVAEFAYISPLDPVSGYFNYHSSQSPDLPGHNGANTTRVSIPELDAAFDAIKNTVDIAKVKVAIATVQDIYASFDKNSYELPLYQRKDVWLVNPKIQNFGKGHPSTPSSQWNIGDWWLQP